MLHQMGVESRIKWTVFFLLFETGVLFPKMFGPSRATRLDVQWLKDFSGSQTHMISGYGH
jgi:hypothetical protein